MAMRPWLYLACAAALSAGTPAHAADTAVCPGSPALAQLKGTWVRAALLAQLKQTRSWAATMAGDTQSAPVYVAADRADFNLSWHEGDTGQVCVRMTQGQFWAQDANSKQWLGPYIRTNAHDLAGEAAVYLAAFFNGCFRSEEGERWCLSPHQISINGQPVPAQLQMDLSEGPFYGTAFATHLSRLPFTVFVPRADGWDVFQDDWASSPDRRPIDTANDRPWRRLKAE